MKDRIFQWFKFVWLRIKTPLMYFGIFCLIVGTAYIVGRCSTKQDRKVVLDNLIAARDSVRHFYITINGLQTQVFERDAVILSKNDAIKSGFLEQQRLKKLHIKELTTNVELTGRIKILEDSLDLPHDVEYITVKDSSGVTKGYIRYPFVLLNIHRKDSVNLIAGLDIYRKAYWKLDIPFSAEMSVGYQKDGFLKTKPVGIFSTTNPYVKIDKMDVVIVKKSEKWFQKKITWVGIYAVTREVVGLILKK